MTEPQTTIEVDPRVMDHINRLKISASAAKEAAKELGAQIASVSAEKHELQIVVNAMSAELEGSRKALGEAQGKIKDLEARLAAKPVDPSPAAGEETVVPS